MLVKLNKSQICILPNLSVEVILWLDISIMGKNHKADSKKAFPRLLKIAKQMKINF